MASHSRYHNIHWGAPCTILVAFLSGLAFALGHHYFYRSLDGVVVSKAVFDQQYNVGIGTGFAFLVRACLVIAVGTTYWQLFWRTVRKNRLTIGNIDTLYGLLSNGFKFFELKAIYRHPTLVLLALLSWLLPFATIVPPATLSVLSTPVQSESLHSLPIPAFSASNMALLETSRVAEDQLTGNISHFYVGTNPVLSRLTLGTAIQGLVPQIDGPSLNSSFTMSFNAPTVQCKGSTNTVLHEFLSNMEGWTKSAYRPHKTYAYQYVSWTPTSTALVPWGTHGVKVTEQINFNRTASYVGQYQGMPPSVFVATLRSDSKTWNVLNCSFYNATYDVHFSFTNGVSSARISSISRNNDPLIISHLVKSVATNPMGGPPRIYPVMTSPQVGYQALIESFGRVVVGTISLMDTFQIGGGGESNSYSLAIDSTSVLDTDLALSKELAPLYATSTSSSVQWSPSAIPNANLTGLSVTGMTLGISVEQLFHNMTLALFSESRFLSSEDVPQTKVIATNTVIKYNYSAMRLVLAYGLAVLCALLSVVIAFITILANAASWSDKFSTILRTTVRQENDIRAGADPLPGTIAKTKIQVGSPSELPSSKEATQESLEQISSAQESKAMLSRSNTV